MPEIDEKMMIDYLLGELSEEEQALAETRLFTEPFYQQLQIVEEDLIEDYLYGELSTPARERFESYFLAAPHRRQRVEFARVMLKALVEKKADFDERENARSGSVPTSRWRMPRFFSLPYTFVKASFVVIGLIAILACAWLIYQNRRMINDAESLRAQRETERDSQREQVKRLQQQIADQQSRNEQLTTELERERRRAMQTEPPSPSIPFAFTLRLLHLKSDQVPPITIPSDKRLLRISLELERAESYRRYRVTLQRADSRGLRQIDSRHAKPSASGRVIITTLPTQLFTTGDYVLSLKGITASGASEEIADYQFAIVIK